MTSFQDAIGNDFAGIIKGEFSEEVVLNHASGGAPETLKGIFDNTYRTMDPATQAVVMSSKPRATIWASDLASPAKQGDSLTARGATYRVVEVQNDGEGSITLYLD